MTSPPQSGATEVARRVGEAVANVVLREMQAGDDAGKQIIIHIPPRANGAIRIQMPPRILEVKRDA